MKRSSYLIGAIILIAGCSGQEFKKAPDGSEYKIFSNENGKNAVAGNFIQINILAKYKDSVLFSSIESSMPRFMPYDTAQLPPFFKKVKEGDSLVIRVSTDSLIKHGQSAPFMKKNEYIYQYFKFAKVFNSEADVEKVAKTFETAAKAIAYKKTIYQIKKNLSDNASQVKTDDQIITDFINRNNIKAAKTDWGTYVSIETPGTGDNLNEKNIAVINYTGRTLKDTVFDSNTDAKFGHVTPIEVDMGDFGVIPGWIDGLKLMKKGSKGKLIIPSSLGYGKGGSGAKIGPNENLLFDIEVTDVITREQFEAKQMEQRNQMMRQQQEMQQRMQQGNPNGQPPPPPAR
ncbi:MAG: FKBP-type peptidyl-prolyl cis-trans isomerase [Ginsengibacter sp.]